MRGASVTTGESTSSSKIAVLVLLLGNAAVDVYGFGQLLWQVLTGESIYQENKRLPR